jgi:hypothetical protein
MVFQIIYQIFSPYSRAQSEGGNRKTIMQIDVIIEDVQSIRSIVLSIFTDYSLKGLCHKFRMGLTWYCWIGLGQDIRR